MNQENKRYFYDIEQNSIDDILRVFIEEGTSKDLTARVNDSLPYTESMVITSRWEYNRHAEAEKEATINTFKLGKEGCNLVIWISPDDDGDIYKEGRLNIEFPVLGEEEWSLYGKHMPLFWNKEESMELAKRLLENGGVSLKEINDSEDLRCQPIGFIVNNIDDWVEKCRELVPEFEEVWKFIENGEDLKNQERVKKAVIKAMIEADGDNYYFESLMLKDGFEINADGGHGSSYGATMSEMGIIVSVGVNGELHYSPGSTEGLAWCNHCNVYFNGNTCPLCGKVVSSEKRAA